MSIATVRFFCAALGRTAPYTAILPDTGEGPYPVLVQLHGLGDDHTAWVTRSRLVDHVAEQELIVVLPDGGTAAYRNLQPPVRAATEHMLGLQRFEDLIVVDLWQHVHHTFKVRPGPWAIGGHSMGGYGAMRLALKYPDRFCSVWAHSGAYRLGDPAAEGPTEDRDGDLFAIARELKPSVADHLAIGFDCGTDDALLEQSRALHVLLDEREVPHHFAEHAGGHDWSYWDEHVQRAVAHHVGTLARSAQVS